MNLFGFLRRRKRKSDEVLQDSPDWWQPGDYAYCEYGCPWVSMKTDLEHNNGPDIGDVRRVHAVTITEGVQFLSFEEFPGQRYQAAAFTKASAIATEVGMSVLLGLLPEKEREDA